MAALLGESERIIVGETGNYNAKRTGFFFIIMKKKETGASRIPTFGHENAFGARKFPWGGHEPRFRGAAEIEFSFFFKV